MTSIETANYLIRLLDPCDPDELREAQKLRYDFLLKEFDQEKNDLDGLDDDGYDAYTDSIVAIDKRTGRIVGTYRLATARTLKGHPYKTEEEFDISALKNDPDGIVEAGRAVVHGDYRNGTVIGLLKAYLMMGAKVSQNGFIDYEFNCCDVMTILDCMNLNERFMKRFLGG